MIYILSWLWYICIGEIDTFGVFEDIVYDTICLLRYFHFLEGNWRV